MRAIIERSRDAAEPYTVTQVLSDNADAAGLDAARALGVPAAAVKVNSLGSYSLMPRSPAMASFAASTHDSRGLVSAPTARSRGAERTASASSSNDEGARTALIRGR